MSRRPAFLANIPEDITDVTELRRHVEQEINRLAETVSTADFYTDVSANNNRLSSLANPAANYDAVNLHTLQKEIEKAKVELNARLYKPNMAYAINTDALADLRAGVVTDATGSLNYQVDPNDGSYAGQLEIAFTAPGDAAFHPGTYYALWIAKSETTPDITAYVRVAAKAGSPLHSPWYTRPSSGTERYYWKVVTNSDISHPPPEAGDPGSYLEIATPAAPAQVSNLVVSLVQVDGVTAYASNLPVRLKWSLTIPNDPELWSFRIDKRKCNSGWTAIGDWQPSGVYGHGPAAGTYTEVMVDSWTLPLATEYWQFRAKSQSHTGLLNDTSPPTYNLTVPSRSDRAGVCTGASGSLNYQVDPNTQAPSGQLEIAFTPPADAATYAGTYYSLWVCKKSSAPALGEYERVSAKSATPIHSPWYVRPSSSTERYYWKLVTNSDASHPAPEAGDPGSYLDIAAPSAPAQVSGFSVSMVKLDNATAIGTYDLFARIKYACTLPSDNQFWNVYIERRKYTSATFATPAGDWYWDGNKFDGMAAGAQVDITVDSFPRPNVTEYWKFRAGARSHYGLVNTTSRPEYNLTFAAQGSAITIDPTTGNVDLATSGTAQTSLSIVSGAVNLAVNATDWLTITDSTGYRKTTINQSQFYANDTRYNYVYGNLLNGRVEVSALKDISTDVSKGSYAVMQATPGYPEILLYYNGAVTIDIDGSGTPSINLIGGSYKIGGTTLVDSTRDATFNSLAIDATGYGFDYLGQAAAKKLTVAGTGAAASIILTDGYMSSDEGYYTASSSGSCFNAPNGGIACKNGTFIESGNNLYPLILKEGGGYVDTNPGTTGYAYMWYDAGAGTIKIRVYTGGAWATKTVTVT